MNVTVCESEREREREDSKNDRIQRERKRERMDSANRLRARNTLESTVDALLTVRKCKIESLCGCVGECVRVCVGGWVCICWIFVRKSCV